MPTFVSHAACALPLSNSPWCKYWEQWHWIICNPFSGHLYLREQVIFTETCLAPKTRHSNQTGKGFMRGAGLGLGCHLQIFYLLGPRSVCWEEMATLEHEFYDIIHSWGPSPTTFRGFICKISRYFPTQGGPYQTHQVSLAESEWDYKTVFIIQLTVDRMLLLYHTDVQDELYTKQQSGSGLAGLAEFVCTWAGQAGQDSCCTDGFCNWYNWVWCTERLISSPRALVLVILKPRQYTWEMSLAFLNHGTKRAFYGPACWRKA